jgi:hypothetical protein
LKILGKEDCNCYKEKKRTEERIKPVNFVTISNNIVVHSHEDVIVLHIIMYLFQGNRTADLVHKLMNISDDPTLKEEVMTRTLILIHIYSNIDSRVGLLIFQLLVQES